LRKVVSVSVFALLAVAVIAGAAQAAAEEAAMAERPEIGGRLLIFLALPETMIILGFLVAFFIIGRIR